VSVSHHCREFSWSLSYVISEPFEVGFSVCQLSALCSFPLTACSPSLLSCSTTRFVPFLSAHYPFHTSLFPSATNAVLSFLTGPCLSPPPLLMLGFDNSPFSLLFCSSCFIVVVFLTFPPYLEGAPSPMFLRPFYPPHYLCVGDLSFFRDLMLCL